jgi:hypothetical protein
MKAITFVCMNSRLGVYRILLSKQGSRSANATKARFYKKINEMLEKKQSNAFQIKRLLNDAARNLSKMSPKSEIIQS